MAVISSVMGDRGLNPDGTIARQGALDRVPATFGPVVGAARALIAGRFGARLHSAYLYGSIPRGTATPGRSDLDLLLALRSDPIGAPGSPPSTPPCMASGPRVPDRALPSRGHPRVAVGGRVQLAHQRIAEQDRQGDVSPPAFGRWLVHLQLIVETENLRDPLAVVNEPVEGRQQRGHPVNGWASAAGSTRQPPRTPRSRPAAAQQLRPHRDPARIGPRQLVNRHHFRLDQGQPARRPAAVPTTTLLNCASVGLVDDRLALTRPTVP